MNIDRKEIPQGDLAGLTRYFKQDVVGGFMVFLVALPLCLGIALASGYPPMAGIFSAIIGAVLATFISNSELTIKGPAAGLIVIAIACIEDFGGEGFLGDFSSDDVYAYRVALAIGVAAAVLQILFGLLRAGILGEFFPLSVVHGMLAAIGVIIIVKQVPVALGVNAGGEPLEMLLDMDDVIEDANPAIAAIGLVSLAIMFLWPMVSRRFSTLRVIPAPLVVLLVAIPMGLAFDLLHSHSYTLLGHKYQLGEQHLVAMPSEPFEMFEEVTFPAFEGLAQLRAWKWVFMFFIIGTLESVLSAKAVDTIDPWKRKTNLNRDMLAVGVANLGSSLIGGLPMISEIVRSKVNVDSGARTRFANLWHGVFLLLCVALIPMVLHLIPLAALAAMLVYTGYRLAHPSEFIHVYHIGREQLVIFLATLVAVLATDLVIGVAIGILVKIGILRLNGVPLRSLFKTYLVVEQHNDNTCLIRAHDSAVFSNWISFRRKLVDLGLARGQHIIVDLTNTKLVDHSVMDKLQDMQATFEQQGLKLEVVGLDAHVPLANHESAARKRELPQMRRITIVADVSQEPRLVQVLVSRGVREFTMVRGRSIRQQPSANAYVDISKVVRLEFVAAAKHCEEIAQFLREEIMSTSPVTVCVETVEVVKGDSFTSDAIKASSSKLQEMLSSELNGR